MQLRMKKARPKAGTPNSASDPAAPNALGITARMHFYAVRSNGDQLRWEHTPRTVKKPDRMVGR
jgi:hypothetical protein